MLRLDPAHPPLWRTPTTLQFGADPVAVVHDPAPWQQRLVHELARGIPEDALEPVAAALGAPDAEADAFVHRIRRALAPSVPAGVRRLTMQVPADFSPTHADTVAAALSASGFEISVATWHDAPREVVADDAPVVVVASHLVHPRRAATLMSHDIAHLPVVFSSTGAEIGPFVRPGRTACLGCVAAHRRDADPSWPLVIAQLVGTPVAGLGAAVAFEAGIVAARLVTEGERQVRRTTTHSLTLRAGSLHRVSRAHRPHAECRCRSLAGIETAADRAAPSPTTARAIARPA